MTHRVQLRARAAFHYIYFGRSAVVTNLAGFVTGSHGEGFFAENTRLLSRFVTCVNGQEPHPVAVTPCGPDRLLGYYELAGSTHVPEKSVYLTVDIRLAEGLEIAIRAENYSLGSKACEFDLGLEVDADFADSQEAETGVREQTAPVDSAWDAARRELRLEYGHPRLRRAVSVTVTEAPSSVSFNGQAIVVPVRLRSHQSANVVLAVTGHFESAGVLPPAGVVGTARRDLEDQVPDLTTSNEVVARAWRTATRDLASLALGASSGPSAPIAGIPLYQQFFGRDTLTAAWHALAAMPGMMRDTLNANAALEGRVIDDWLDEEPGKLIHQETRGPLASLGLTNNLRNYGDYATAPDFLIMLGQYLAWTDDRATVRRLLPVARRVLEWIDRYGDLDGDGFIEYRTRSPKGVKNQGWKDADDAIVDEHGEVVQPPIATIELQAYVYAGLQQAAVAFALAGGDRAFAASLLRRARRLRRAINERFWMPDQGFYAMALGPDKRQVRSISSNPAHALAAGVVPRDRADAVVRRLMQRDMFSGWGIRTLSADHPAYNPFSYHRGSVWPVENGTAALGLARYGRWSELHALAGGLFDLSELFQEGRLPESVGGMPRDHTHPQPGIYPASCDVQAWSASMIVVLIQSVLGMLPFAPLRLLLVDPHLPPCMPDLRLTGLGVGDARVDLAVWRTAGGRTRYRAETHGRVRVVRQPPPQAPSTAGSRAWSALRSLITT